MIQLTEKQQRRKASWKALRSIFKGWASIKKSRPEKDPEYLRWLRSQPCAIETCSSQYHFRPQDMIEAAHIGEIRGLRQKCSDREAIPLCVDHHRNGPVSHHVLGKTFFLYWSFNRKELINKYNERYEAERGS